MKPKVLKLLEYDKIIEMLKEKASCCVGRELACQLVPAGQFGQIEKLLKQTSDAEAALYRLGKSPIDDFPDMRDCLKRMHAALYISPAELLNIARCLNAIRRAKESLKSFSDAEYSISNMIEALEPRRRLEEEIERCIISEEEIADAASPVLFDIRKRMRSTNEKIREKLNAMIRSASYQKYLQEPLITIRNGRFVLPVKQEYRQHIPGLIHDMSGSGATLYIEPAAAVELGNEYKRLQGEEAEEIERILIGLTAAIEPYAQSIYDNLLILGELDLIFSKAALARDMRAICPKLSRSKIIKIARGRHPLINPDTVVPVDVWIGNEFTTLIITGPNTGGKTVTLKTIGVFVLMMQSGLFVPADIGTELGVFTQVFADIGDEQSIEQSLSTFSSHMSNIVDILKEADADSLVLLDELGAGTDPVEGAALAMSILEELHERRLLCVATTHYSEIKAFALTHEGMENASMEFDIDRLCPTYRLFIGIPGKSNAFEISKRLGLSENIINKAREFLHGDDIKFEDVLSSAESYRKTAEQEKKIAQQTRAELERLRAEAAAERKRLEDERAKLIQKAKEDARKIVAEARQETEKIIKKLKAASPSGRSDIDRAIQESRDEIRKQEQLHSVEPAIAKQDHGNAPKTIKPGQTVKILSLNQNATVISGPDPKGEVLVQAGIMKLNVKFEDLRLANESKSESGGIKIPSAVNKQIALELDLRGKLVDEAIVEVDRYLDDAFMCGLSEISLIHGKGTGALRAGIHEYLKHHPRVKDFRLGNYGEGDAGVTIVKIKA